MEFDLKLLQRLLNHGRVDEAGYPSGMDAPEAASGVDHNEVNNMGDNPMVDPAKLEESEGAVTPEMIELLKQTLGDVGANLSDVAVGDYEVRMNGDITIGSTQVSPDAVMEFAIAASGDEDIDPMSANDLFLDTLEALSEQLDESTCMACAGKQELDEFRAPDAPVDARFTYVVDTLGHVTINDAQTGKSVYLQGSDAIELMGQLEGVTGEGQMQQLLSQYQHVMENCSDNPELDYCEKARTEVDALEAKLDQMTMDAYQRRNVVDTMHMSEVMDAFTAFKNALFNR